MEQYISVSENRLFLVGLSDGMINIILRSIYKESNSKVYQVDTTANYTKYIFSSSDYKLYSIVKQFAEINKIEMR